MNDEVREAVAAAYAAHEEPNETPTEEVPAQENQEPEIPSGHTPVEPSSSEPVDKAAEATEELEETKVPKFLPAEEVEDSTPVESTDSSEPAESSEPTEPEVPAPVAWRGDAKQHWTGLPREVQEEAVRREGEINRVLRESAESRHNWKQFNDAVQPYQSVLAAEGVDALTATRNLMQTAAGLRFGTPQQKAALVAKIVHAYGVDFKDLDNALAGDTQGQAGAPDVRVMQAIDQRLAPVQQFINQQNQVAQDQARQQKVEADTEVDAFAKDPKNVFFEDVRDDMALLLETASRSRREMSLEQAYRTAVSMNPKLASLEQRRQQVERAKKNGASLASKKKAASSIASSSPPETTKPPTTVRGAVEAAFAKHGA